MKKNKMTEKQYEILISSAEKVTDRRMSQNNVYTTLNLAFLSYVVTSKVSALFTVLLCIIGIVMVFNWLFTIKSYASRNGVKFSMINEYERETGFELFNEEYKRIKKLKNVSSYEKVPVYVFGLVYVVVAIVTIF